MLSPPGIVVIDTLCDYAVEPAIVAGLTALGLDPRGELHHLGRNGNAALLLEAHPIGRRMPARTARVLDRPLMPLADPLDR